MSTRCQIGFYQTKPTKKTLLEPDALIYRHSDGYPKGVLPELLPIIREFHSKRGLDDTEYASGRTLQALCNQYDMNMTKWGYKTDFLGYGIAKDFHGDIEYYYAVSPESVRVYSVSIPWDKPITTDCFKLIKSEPITVENHD